MENGRLSKISAMMAVLGIALALFFTGCRSQADRAPGVGDRKPMVALTFDDGPGPYTDRILDILEQHGGRATFFVLGRNVAPWRDTVIRTVDMGSEVAGHSWTHPELTTLTDEEITEELRRTSEVIEQLTGIPQSFYRPPFGLLDQRVVSVSAELGYAMVNWTLDTNDWRPEVDADAVYNTIMNEVRDGSVILMHDTLDITAAAMERVIPALIASGYQLVPVSELLNHFYGELRPGRVYGINWNMPWLIFWP